MKEMMLSDVLSLQLSILQRVDRFCRENSIPYTVDGGTCIGAVRHHGYIPWDDDIDIAMTRPNYERFIRSFNGYDNNLEVYAPELNWNYYAPYANVCDKRTILVEGSNGHNGMDIGVKIDVFPIDGVASDINEYHRNNRRIAFLWNALYIKRAVLEKTKYSCRSMYIKFLIKRAILSFISYASIQKSIRRLALKHPFENSEFVEDFIFPWPHDVRCPRRAFEDYMDVPFENISVSIIKGYDEYLSRLYGDYMTLPPEEKRVAHHGFKAYWKEG